MYRDRGLPSLRMLNNMNNQIAVEDMHRPPTHPGLMLLELFLDPLHMTQVELAKAINVPIQRINEIINQRRGVTPETALRLGKYFGVSSSYWLGLQKKHDLWNAYQKEKSSLDKIIPRDGGSEDSSPETNTLSDWLKGLSNGEWKLSGTFSQGGVVFAGGVHEKVAQLYSNQAAESGLGKDLSSISDSDALAYLIQSTGDEGIRRQAIDLLLEVEPSHTLFSAVREKDLSIHIENHSIVLRVMLIPKVDRRFSVLARVYATGSQRFLPEGLELTVLSERGDKIAPDIVARAHDDWLDRPLGMDSGDRFSIRITLDESVVTESFTV